MRSKVSSTKSVAARNVSKFGSTEMRQYYVKLTLAILQVEPWPG